MKRERKVTECVLLHIYHYKLKYYYNYYNKKFKRFLNQITKKLFNQEAKTVCYSRNQNLSYLWLEKFY